MKKMTRLSWVFFLVLIITVVLVAVLAGFPNESRDDMEDSSVDDSETNDDLVSLEVNQTPTGGQEGENKKDVETIAIDSEKTGPSSDEPSFEVSLDDVDFISYTRSSGEKGFLLNLIIDNLGDELEDRSYLVIEIPGLKVKVIQSIDPFSGSISVEDIFVPIGDSPVPGTYPVYLSMELDNEKIGEAESFVDVQSVIYSSGGSSRRRSSDDDDDDDDSEPTPTPTATPTPTPTATPTPSPNPTSGPAPFDIDLEIVSVNDNPLDEEPIPLVIGNKIKIVVSITPDNASESVVLDAQIPGTDISYAFSFQGNIPIDNYMFELDVPASVGEYDVELSLSEGDVIDSENFEIIVDDAMYKGEIIDFDYDREKYHEGDSIFVDFRVKNTGLFDLDDAEISIDINDVVYESDPFLFSINAGDTLIFNGGELGATVITCHCVGEYDYPVRITLSNDGQVLDVKQDTVTISDNSTSV